MHAATRRDGPGVPRGSLCRAPAATPWEFRRPLPSAPLGTVKKALERDLELTKHDLSFGKAGEDLDQDVDETIKQAAGKQPIPPKHVPNPD